MASMIQIPDSLSLLRNLKEFIVSSANEVSFTLRHGGNEILSETYYPDTASRIVIDVQQVVSRYLETALPTSNAFRQAGAKAAFTALVNGAQVASFSVINAGVRKLSTTAAEFLAANWLTWQPQSKQVGWNQPEYLSFYFSVDGTVRARFYLLDGTQKTVQIASATGGSVWTFNTTMSYLFSLAGVDVASLAGYVDVWTEDGNGNQLSYMQRYLHANEDRDDHFYLCVNSLGGIDTFNFHGNCTFAPDVEHETGEAGATKLNITEKAERQWQQNTGFQGKTCMIWMWELLAAAKQWAVIDGNAEPIVIDTSSLEMNDRENLHACTFSYKLAEEGRLLNITRTSYLPDIDIPTPAGEIFFLKARLIDYPDADLEDTILFLVQSPYNQSWGKVSLGAIREWLLNIITGSEIGLKAHNHENKDILDRFSEQDGMAAYNGERLTTRAETERKYLRKDIPDQAAGKIDLLDGARFGEFIPGITGRGGHIDRNGNGELQSLILHRFLEVPELRYNRISIQVGNDWRSPGGGIIEAVAPDTDAAGDTLPTGIITLHLEDGEIGTVAVDDICMGVFHDGMTLSNTSVVDWDDSKGNFRFAGFFTAYFRVTEILDGQNKRFRYALRGLSDAWQHTFHPCEAMHFVAYGNFTDETRQTSRYSTRTYERYLSGVNDWEFSASNIAAQFGDLSNLTVFGLDMTGYSAYLNNIYMSGTIQQFENLPLRMEIDTQGDSFLAWGGALHVSCRVWKGLYEDVTDQVETWTITRDSGDAVDDEAWRLSAKVQAFHGTIDICFREGENDLGGNTETISTLFTIRAELPSGDVGTAQITI